MRVGIDLSPWTYGPRRGVARALDHLLAGLALVAAPDVRIAAFHAGATVGEGLARFPTFRHVPPPAAGLSPADFRRRLPALVAEERLDAFVSPWSAFPRLRTPVVVWVHELPFVRRGPVEGRWRTLAHRWWLRRDVRHAAAIVVPSEAVRDDLLARHPQARGRVDVVPHGFDPRPWRRPAAESARPGDGSAPAAPTGLVVGARGARKGLDVLARALADLADLGTAWVLVGEPTAAARRRWPRGTPFEVLASPGDAELATLYGRASLLVYPSRSEGFGFPPLEAMAAGCPVVATRAGAIPEVCGDGALLVPADDPAALAGAIRLVLGDAGVRADLVARGTLRADAFPVEANASRWWDVVRRAAGGAR